MVKNKTSPKNLESYSTTAKQASPYRKSVLAIQKKFLDQNDDATISYPLIRTYEYEPTNALMFPRSNEKIVERQYSNVPLRILPLYANKAANVTVKPDANENKIKNTISCSVMQDCEYGPISRRTTLPYMASKSKSMESAEFESKQFCIF
jgi:hypothetical protein